MAPCQGGEESQPIRARVRAMSFFADCTAPTRGWAARPARWHGSRLRDWARGGIRDHGRAVSGDRSLAGAARQDQRRRTCEVGSRAGRPDGGAFPSGFSQELAGRLALSALCRCGRRSPAKTSPQPGAGSMNRGWRCGPTSRDGHPPGARFGSVCGAVAYALAHGLQTGGGASGGLASSLRARRGGRRRGLRGGVPR